MPKKYSKEEIDIIVTNAQNNDNTAFTLLYKIYNNMVKQQIYFLCKDNELAKDIANDIWIKIISNIKLYKNEYSFSTWLQRITKNYYLDIIKKKKIQTVNILIKDNDDNDVIFFEPESKDIISIDALIKDETNTFIDNILHNMPINFKNVIKLRYFDELSYDQIASELNMNVASVKTYLNRAKKWVKDNYDYKM